MDNLVEIRPLPWSVATTDYYDFARDERRTGPTIMVSIIVRKIQNSSAAALFKPTKTGLWHSWQRIPYETYLSVVQRINTQ